MSRRTKLGVSANDSDVGPVSYLSNDSPDDYRVTLNPTTNTQINTTEEISTTEKYGMMRYLYLSILSLVFASNIVKRYLIVFLYNAPTDDLTPEEAAYQSIKVALNITTTQYGVLTGPAFMVTLALSALIAGQVTGSVPRKWVLATVLLIWSSCIGMLYYAEQYWHVLISRLLLGAAEGFCPPLAYSLIAAYFDKHQRSTANGVFASGIYVGYGLASTSLIALSHFGWRYTCLYLGLIGAILFLIVSIFVKEPESVNEPLTKSTQKDTNVDVEEPLLRDHVIGSEEHIEDTNTPPADKKGIFYLFHLLYVILKPNDMKVLFMAASFRMIAGVILGVYFPTYIRKAFPTQKDEFAVLNLVVVIAGGTISTIFGGRIASKWAQASGVKKVTAFAKNIANTVGYPPANQYNDVDNNAINSNQTNDTTLISSNSSEYLGPLPVIDDYSPYGFVCAISCLCSIPAFMIVFWYDHLYVAMGALFVAYLFSECWSPLVYGLLQNVEDVPQYAKLMSFSLVTTSTSLFAAISPVVVGIFDDKYHNEQLELTVAVLVPLFISGLLFLYVAYAQSKRTTIRLQKAFLGSN